MSPRLCYAALMRLEELGEFGLIDRIRRQVGNTGAAVVLGIGDDTAALRPNSGRLLLATCDCQVEGRHFVRDRITPEQLGRRLAAVNLSDIGSMGGEPRWALLSLVLPPSLDVAFVEECYGGLVAELGLFGAQIVGGNLAAGEQIVLDMTLLGEVAPEHMLLRNGAKAGDAVMVTGTLGASAAGRAALAAGLSDDEAAEALAAHLTPEPRVAAGQVIGRSGLATATLDISDGLARDLGHLCDASGVDVLLTVEHLPISPSTRWVAARLGLDPLRLALAGGEDYELLCAVPASAAIELAGIVRHETGLALTAIGAIRVAGSGRWLEQAGGQREHLGDWGWQHFALPASER